MVWTISLVSGTEFCGFAGYVFLGFSVYPGCRSGRDGADVAPLLRLSMLLPCDRTAAPPPVHHVGGVGKTRKNGPRGLGYQLVIPSLVLSHLFGYRNPF